MYGTLCFQWKAVNMALHPDAPTMAKDANLPLSYTTLSNRMACFNLIKVFAPNRAGDGHVPALDCSHFAIVVCHADVALRGLRRLVSDTTVKLQVSTFPYFYLTHTRMQNLATQTVVYCTTLCPNYI